MSRAPRFKRKAFKFPLTVHWGKVFTADGHMAFNFCKGYGDKTWLQSDLVSTINGEKEADYENMELIYVKDESTIYVNGKPFISIRGWGHLTSTGGLNYQPHKAAKLQDEFAEFIIQKLTPNAVQQ